MKTCQDVYMEPEVFRYNNCVIRVHRPILSDEERKQRVEQIKRATISLIAGSEKNKENLFV